jgi:two-component system chemotaxis response regulator CheB
MGRDGAAELKLMRDGGAATFVQDKESSVIYGMPGEAIRLDAAVYVLPPEKIAGAVETLIHCSKQPQQEPCADKSANAKAPDEKIDV